LTGDVEIIFTEFQKTMQVNSDAGEDQ